MGKKYVIELEDKPLCVFDEDAQTYFPRLYRVKGFNSLVFDQTGLDKLTPLEDYKQPEEPQNKFSVGDRVIFGDCSAVILDETEEYGVWAVLTENGCVEIVNEDLIVNTGRHYDDVKKLIEKLR